MSRLRSLFRVREVAIVRGYLDELTLPRACACCLAEVSEGEHLKGIPYCPTCRAHAGGARLWVIALLVLVAGGAAVVLGPLIYPPLTPWTWAGAVALAGGVVWALLLLLWRVPELDRRHACREVAFEIGDREVLFANAEYAERVAAANAAAWVRGEAPNHALSGWPIQAAAWLLPVVFAAWYHGESYTAYALDNGTDAPLSVEVDGVHVAEVQPRQPVFLDLPRRDLTLTALGPGGVVEELHIADAEPGLRIFNPGALRCYEVRTDIYTSGGWPTWVRAPSARLVRGVLIVSPAGYDFGPAPASIEVREDPVYTPPATSVERLVSVPCPGERR